MRIAEFLSYTCPEPNSGCLLWMGAYNYDKKHGPRGIVTRNKKTRYASRVAYELFKGPLRPGEVVRHKCDTPLCVHEDHLLKGTQLDNIADRVTRDRNGNALGEAHPKAVLTEEDVRQVRALRAAGMSWARLAARFGTSLYCMRYAVERGWRHV